VSPEKKATTSFSSIDVVMRISVEIPWIRPELASRNRITICFSRRSASNRARSVPQKYICSKAYMSLRSPGVSPMVDRPRSDVERGGCRLDAVRRPEVGEVEAVREDDVRLRIDPVRRENDAAGKVPRDVRQLECRFAAEPRPEEAPPLGGPVAAETTRRRNRIARGMNARPVAAPAPAVKSAPKPLRGDVGEREVAAKVRTPIVHDTRVFFKIPVRHEPACAGFDLAQSARSHLPLEPTRYHPCRTTPGRANVPVARGTATLTRSGEGLWL
jgi:hypothetical protein